MIPGLLIEIVVALNLQWYDLVFIHTLNPNTIFPTGFDYLKLVNELTDKTEGGCRASIGHAWSRRVDASTAHIFFSFFINHGTSRNLYWSYYSHLSRELVSPVCGIFLAHIFNIYLRIFQFDNFQQSKVYSEGRFEMRISIFLFNFLKSYGH